MDDHGDGVMRTNTFLSQRGVTHVRMRTVREKNDVWGVPVYRNSSDDSSMAVWEKSRARRRLFWRHTKTNIKSILQHWWTDVILRMRSCNSYVQKYKGRVVLRGDIVKNDSGAHAVFDEQGSSASPDDGRNSNGSHCKTTSDEQVADAVSAYTWVKFEECHQIAQNSKLRVSRYTDRSSTTKTLTKWWCPRFRCTMGSSSLSANETPTEMIMEGL